MAKLNIEINGYNNSVQDMLINGKRAKVKRKKNKYLVSTDISTNNAEIVIYRGHYYLGKAWVFWDILCFIISVFGIFDTPYNRQCVVIDYKCRVDVVEDTNLVMNINHFTDGGRFIEHNTEAKVEEDSNVFYIDQLAKTRRKKMKKVKLGIAILIVAITVLLISVL